MDIKTLERKIDFLVDELERSAINDAIADLYSESECHDEREYFRRMSNVIEAAEHFVKFCRNRDYLKKYND